MRKEAIITIILILIIGTLLFFLSRNLILTSKVTKENVYTFTKAICTENNYCQDYELKCNNAELVSMSQITGAAVQFSKDWQDPRNETTINKWC